MGADNGFRLMGKFLLAGFFLSFLVYPLLLIVLRVFSAENAFPLALEAIFSGKNLLLNSFLQASLSTFFALLIGIPAAYLLASREFPGKKLLRAFSFIPFVMPSILVVLSFVIVFGNNGWVNSFLQLFFGTPEPVNFIYGLSGIILAHVFYNFPLVMLFVSSAWERIDSGMDDAARSLGAAPVHKFFRVTLPQLIPSIAASASLVFIYCFMSFAIVLSFGGVKFPTFEVEIFRQLSRNINFEVSAVLAFFQFAFLMIFVFLYAHFSKKFSVQSSFPIEKKIPFAGIRGFAESFFLFLISVFVLLPISSIVFFAFFGNSGFSLDAFKTILFSPQGLYLASPLQSILLSLFLAFFSSLLATFIGLLASLKETRIPFAGIFLGSSVAISGITFALAYYLGFGPGNIFIILAGHSVISFPFSFRIISGALEKINSDVIDSARSLGADWLSTLKLVQLPLIKNSLLVSFAFSFAISLGELAFVLSLSNSVYATMPVYIYRFISVFNIPSAAAMGVILILISLLSFYMIERFSGKSRVFW